MAKKIVYVIIGLLVIAGLVWAFMPSKSSSSESHGAQPSHHTIGNGKKNVTLVQYGDFQCPGCGAFYPILKQVTDKYKDDITFQFVNFPLDQLHQNARAAHRAAEAASNQGKFWEMHDSLYESQQNWASSTDVKPIFDSFAKSLSLDMAKFNADYASTAVNDTINADIATGQALKVTGTPTFFIDGVQVEDNQTVASVEKFSAVLDAEIAKKNPTTAPSQ